MPKTAFMFYTPQGYHSLETTPEKAKAARVALRDDGKPVQLISVPYHAMDVTADSFEASFSKGRGFRVSARVAEIAGREWAKKNPATEMLDETISNLRTHYANSVNAFMGGMRNAKTPQEMHELEKSLWKIASAIDKRHAEPATHVFPNGETVKVRLKRNYATARRKADNPEGIDLRYNEGHADAIAQCWAEITNQTFDDAERELQQ